MSVVNILVGLYINQQNRGTEAKNRLKILLFFLLGGLVGAFLNSRERSTIRLVEMYLRMLQKIVSQTNVNEQSLPQFEDRYFILII